MPAACKERTRSGGPLRPERRRALLWAAGLRGGLAADDANRPVAGGSRWTDSDGPRASVRGKVAVDGREGNVPR